MAKKKQLSPFDAHNRQSWFLLATKTAMLVVIFACMTKADGFWRRWETYFSPEEFQRFCDAQTAALPKTIRVNTLRNSVAEFAAWIQVHRPDWRLRQHGFGEGIFCIDRQDRTIPLGNTLEHAEGRFYIQEASSCLPPLALAPQPGETVLDMAAAPGSKSTQLAAMMKGRGLLVTNELVTSRVKKLVFNLQRCGVPNAMVTSVDGTRFGEAVPDSFDAILLDAPCTGEGTFRKDRAALDLWSLARIEEAAYLQEQLLAAAWRALKPGGRLVYSTCTLAPEENERVVARFLQQVGDGAGLLDLQNLFPGAEQCAALTRFEIDIFPDLDKALRIWPQTFDSEGFFVAAIQKSHSTPLLDYSKAKKHKQREDGPSRIELTELERFLQTYGFAIPDGFAVIKRASERRTDYWMLPAEGKTVLAALPVSRPGVRIAERHGKKLRIDHEFAVTFGGAVTGKQVIDVSTEEARHFLRKEYISVPHDEQIPAGDLIIRHAGVPLGIVKNINGTLKNNLPIHFANAEIR